MIGDKGRETAVFSEAEDFETPVFYSGRAVLASDLNEANDRQVAGREKALIDVIGHVGWPRKAPGFRPHKVLGMVHVAAGRMYVDGARFERRTPRNYTIQELGGTQFDGRMVLVACCDKTERDHLDFPFIRDDGLGGPDTAGRRNGFVDIKLVRMNDILADNGGTEAGLRAKIEDGQLLKITNHDGRARFSLQAGQPATDDHCMIAPAGGFNRQGNFNYLVQIHDPGPTGTATFKWAREDVRALIEQPGGGGGTTWQLREEPTDDQRRFATGNTIEIKGAQERAMNRSGVLGKITSLDPDTRQVELTADATQALSDMDGPLTITRWDQPFDTGTARGLPTTTGVTALENNLAINFTGDHLAGDFWYCAARIRTGDILWPPRDHDAQNGLVEAFNWGPRCVGFGMVDVAENTIIDVEDLRTTFPDLNHIEARDVTISGIPPCGLTTGMTVQEALARICALTRDPCCLTVRPDEIDDDLLDIREDLAELPTLSEALSIWKEVLEQLKLDTGQPYNRRMALKFTQGVYKWEFEAMSVLRDLHSLSLTACSGAPVILELSEWLTADRCMNLRMDGLTVECSQTGSGFSVTGGKSVEITNCYFRRNHTTDAPILKLAARRAITLRDTRVHLDKVRDVGGFRPAIQVMDARAQTHFDNVQSNGSVIVGPITPTTEDDPTSQLSKSITDDRIASPFGPVQQAVDAVGPEQSAPTFRMNGCKIWKFIPDALMMEDLRAWSEDGEVKEREFSINVADRFHSGIRGEHLGHTDFVFFERQGAPRPIDWEALAKDNFILKLPKGEIHPRFRVPFRVLDISDTEFRRGTSLFVAQTVTLRNCRFTQFGDAIVFPEKLRNIGDKLPFGGSEFDSMVYKPPRNATRAWYPVGMTFCNWTGLDGNMGFPDQGHSLGRRPKLTSEKDGLPLLVDFGRRNPNMGLHMALAGSVFDALRMRLVTLHAMEIRGTLDG